MKTKMYHADIRVRPNANFLYPPCETYAEGEAENLEAFRDKVDDHFRAWGYDYTIKQIRRI